MTGTAGVARRVGLIGAGTMGGPIGRNLIAAGHRLRVHDRDPAAVERLVADGAHGAASPAAAADGAEVVLCSLPGPAEVAACLIDGVLAAGTLPGHVVDLSTNDPGTVAELAARCRSANVTFVDAPVSGGPAKAASGELSVMVGATPETLAAVEPVLRSFAADVVRVGDVGTGTVAKLVNNQLFLAGEVLVQEAYLVAAAHGLDLRVVHDVLRASSASTYATLAPLLLSRRFDDVIFRLDIAAKDLRLAVAAAEASGLDVPVTRGALDVFDAAESAGDGARAFHATLLELERRSGTTAPALSRERPT